MIKAIEINGKAYKPAELDFNTMCDMEDLGVSIFETENKGLSAVRAYLAVSAGISKEEAGAEIGEHIANGGSLEVLSEAFSEAVRESTFFRTPAKATTKKNTKVAAEA